MVGKGCISMKLRASADNKEFCHRVVGLEGEKKNLGHLKQSS